MYKNHAFIVLRLISVILILIAFVLAFSWIFSISYPFWIAALLVWMFYPLVRVLNTKAHFPKSLSVFVVLFISLAVIVGAVTGLVFLAIFGIRRFADFIPEWIETTADDLQHFFNDSILPLWTKLGQSMDIFTPEQQEVLQDRIAKFGTNLAGSFTETAQNMLEGATQIFTFIPTFIIAFVFIFIAFYFIGKDWERILNGIRRVTPTSAVEKIKLFKNILRYRVFGFVRAQIILMGIASMIVFIGITILQVEHTFTIALIVGLAEVLPYLGSGTILIPWALYMLFTGNIGMGIGLAVLYGITFAVRQSIEPKVLSSSMNINALAALISLFVGMKLFGVIGVFLGPLLLIVLVVILDIGLARDLVDFIMHGFKDDNKDNGEK